MLPPLPAAALLAFAPQSGGAPQPAPPAEPRATFDLLDGGAFAQRPGERSPAAGCVPWWRALGAGADGPPRIEVDDSERAWLFTAPGEAVEQPIAAYLPLSDGWVLRGMTRGPGQIRVVDATGASADLLVPGIEPEADPRPPPLKGVSRFELTGADFGRRAGHAAVPRLVLRLEGAAADRATGWTNLELLAPLPLPSEQALRAEIVQRLDEIFSVWFERGLDRDGPEPTGFACHGVDVVTGERLTTIPGSWLDLWDHVLFALEVEPNPRWRAALEAFLDDFLTRGIHPATGLPRRWDCVRDVPLDGEVVEITAHLRFLCDVAEHGPQDVRARALEAARRMGQTVLEHGVLPDGSVASRYVPATAEPNTDSVPIRRLNVPAQLARVGALTGRESFTDAARRAVAELEYLHHWGGRWNRLDPDFDDTFGTLGAALVTMLEARPDDAELERPLKAGAEHFVPLWRDALRCGGSIAADQVRCWKVLARYARLRPAFRAQLEPLLHDAVRAHFKGEQYGDGAWIDVTFEGFDPKVGLEVGDLPGTPANLLWGLGEVYAADLGLRSDEVRAMYTAVLRSTVEHYRRPYGYLGTWTERSGRNPPGADLRLGYGLVAMLRRLSGR